MKADAILTADIHLREDQPVAWTKDYWQAQKEVIEFLSKLQQQHKCPVLIAGDVFDRWRPSPRLLAWAIRNMPDKCIAVAGQHDLPNHNATLFTKCGLNVLHQAGVVKAMETATTCALGTVSRVLHAFPYGAPLNDVDICENKTQIALCHIMTYRRRPPYPGCPADNASKLMSKMEGFDLIVTGDNHDAFVVEDGDRLLVNPGSLMAMTAKQIDFNPRVYLWFAEDNSVEPEYMPFNKKSISRKHIETAEERDDRMDAFVSSLISDDMEMELSYQNNLKQFMAKNKTDKPVQQLVWEAVE